MALWLVLQPILSRAPRRVLAVEPPDPEETPKGVALAALKEIEFDRETGKLSDADYELLKAKYTAAALDAIRAEEREGRGAEAEAADIEAMIAAKVRSLHPAAGSAGGSDARCATCGPRPEPDAVFCSTCGRRLPVPVQCAHCAAALPPGSQYCDACGRQVAA